MENIIDRLFREGLCGKNDIFHKWGKEPETGLGDIV